MKPSGHKTNRYKRSHTSNKFCSREQEQTLPIETDVTDVPSKIGNRNSFKKYKYLQFSRNNEFQLFSFKATRKHKMTCEQCDEMFNGTFEMNRHLLRHRQIDGKNKNYKLIVLNLKYILFFKN